GHRRAAGGDAVAAGAGPATPRLQYLAARAAGTERAGNPAVPHDRRRLRPAQPDPADRRAVRGGLPLPAPGPQERAEHAVLAGVRRAAAGALALRLARRAGRALDPDRDGAAVAGLLRQQVRAGAAAGQALSRDARAGTVSAPGAWPAPVRWPRRQVRRAGLAVRPAPCRRRAASGCRPAAAPGRAGAVPRAGAATAP